MNETTLVEKLLKFMKEMKHLVQKEQCDKVESDPMNKEEMSDFDDEIIKYDNNGQWQITKKNNNP